MNRATATKLFPEPVKKALCHPSRPEKAKGMCSPCYRADLKAKAEAAALERSKATEGDKNETAILRDLEKDPEAKKRFYEIMWAWLDAAANVPECWKTENGKRVRDYATEAKLSEIAQRKGDKAATVLGRAYVVEKREEIKPEPLPLGPEIDASGWEPDEMGANETDEGAEREQE